MASVSFDRVTKSYEGVTAVDDLTLEISDGEFMVLLGPSGCGKTTALRMIAGLEEITSGTLRVGDRVVNDVDPARRDVSMVFQSYALYPHMTVRGNIESPLLTRKYPVDAGRPPRKLTKAERAARVSDAAAVLELNDYLDRKPKALSGGQRQRVALARAIVSQPKAFLMDEPLSNLDAKLRGQTRRELSKLHADSGSTVVYVTHDQIEAMTMATRIAIMSRAQLQQVGTPKEVYNRPANLFVAQFIGSPPMNCVPAVVGGGAVRVGESSFPIPSGLQTDLQDGQPVVLGVRPEDLGLADSGSVSGTVTGHEWIGHEHVLFVDVGGHAMSVRLPGDSAARRGQVSFSVDAARTHLFDPETGKRLP